MLCRQVQQGTVPHQPPIWSCCILAGLYIAPFALCGFGSELLCLRGVHQAPSSFHHDSGQDMVVQPLREPIAHHLTSWDPPDVVLRALLRQRFPENCRIDHDLSIRCHALRAEHVVPGLGVDDQVMPPSAGVPLPSLQFELRVEDLRQHRPDIYSKAAIESSAVIVSI